MIKRYNNIRTDYVMVTITLITLLLDISYYTMFSHTILVAGGISNSASIKQW